MDATAADPGLPRRRVLGNNSSRYPHHLSEEPRMGALIDYGRPDGGKNKGYYAEAGKGKPGIVVIQEWWGLNDQICGVADRFAAAGYNALAPDLYKGRVTQKPDEANHMMSGLDFVGASDQDIAGAVKHLAAMSGKVGVMGFCL